MVNEFPKILSYISALHLQEGTFARSQHHSLPQACKTGNRFIHNQSFHSHFHSSAI